MAFYYLMRKDQPITVVSIDETGTMIRFEEPVKYRELAPIQYMSDPLWLKKWWAERAVPLSRDRLHELLQANGCSLPSEYLVRNLGLSLTDYYWVKPVESNLSWGKVNLFSNDFREDLFLLSDTAGTDPCVPHYTPNSSLQGDIQKTWVISNGSRCLVKGNRDELSAESMNEVIASRIHQDQGYDNYAEYKLISIKNRDYIYGCITPAFTSLEKEFIPAWAVYTSEKKENDISAYDHFFNICVKNGMEPDQLRKDLDYMISTDFIISEYDRHLNNFGILRDADTLKWERLAPIFDSGGALFVNRALPHTTKELLNISIHGLFERERTLYNKVRDRNVLDLSKLPSSSYILETYQLDPNMPDERIRSVCHWYEQKIDICRDLQLGHDPWKAVYSVP